MESLTLDMFGGQSRPAKISPLSTSQAAAGPTTDSKLLVYPKFSSVAVIALDLSVYFDEFYLSAILEVFLYNRCRLLIKTEEGRAKASHFTNLTLKEL